jgi:hypothetical protein
VLAWDGLQVRGVAPAVDKEFPITLLVTTLALNSPDADSGLGTLAGPDRSSSGSTSGVLLLEAGGRPSRIAVAKRSSSSASGATKAKPAPVVAVLERRRPVHFKRGSTTLGEVAVTLALQVSQLEPLQTPRRSWDKFPSHQFLTWLSPS